MIAIVDEQKVAFVLDGLSPRVLQLEDLLRVFWVFANFLHCKIIANDGLVVARSRKLPCCAKQSPGEVHCRLVSYRRKSFFAAVAPLMRKRTGVPLHMRYVGRTDSAVKSQLVAVFHDLPFIIPLWKPNVVMVQPLRKFPAECMEDLMHGGLTHQGQLAHVLQENTPPENLQRRQNLRGWTSTRHERGRQVSEFASFENVTIACTLLIISRSWNPTKTLVLIYCTRVQTCALLLLICAADFHEWKKKDYSRGAQELAEGEN